MSGGWMALVEIMLVFGAVFAFGFYELFKLKQYRNSKTDESARNKNNDYKDLET